MPPKRSAAAKASTTKNEDTSTKPTRAASSRVTKSKAEATTTTAKATKVTKTTASKATTTTAAPKTARRIIAETSGAAVKKITKRKAEDDDEPAEAKTAKKSRTDTKTPDVAAKGARKGRPAGAAGTSKTAATSKKGKTTATANKKTAAAATAKAKKPATHSTATKKASTPEEDEVMTEDGDAADEAGKDAHAPDQAKTTKAVRATKRKATEEVQPPAKKARVVKKGPIINEVPTTRLQVFVFGEGSNGELGLGSAKNAIDVKRPRLNANLAADTVGVVQVAVGGMHCAALTHDNKILTWGVNDQGALGRDTTWEGGLRDVDDESDDEASDSGMNPFESTPAAVPADSFPEGTIFTEVAAGDSTTFAVTDDGRVWGWGTFRSNDGIMGFTASSFVQTKPMLIPELKAIKTIATGSNHALALTAKGKVFAWGCGQQNQLGRRVVERTRTNGLKPREVAVSRRPVTHIACGAYHSFALDADNRVWAWGLNSFGETGIRDGAGENGAVVSSPTPVEALEGWELVALKGGAHHSIAVTAAGECLVWGRLDGGQTGTAIEGLPAAHLIRDEAGRPRILAVPTAIPGLQARSVSAGSDTSLLITPAGQAYTWGFSGNYQTGQGTDEDVEVPTLIDNTATRGRALNWGALGGQFGVLTAPVVPAAAE